MGSWPCAISSWPCGACNRSITRKLQTYGLLPQTSGWDDGSVCLCVCMWWRGGENCVGWGGEVRGWGMGGGYEGFFKITHVAEHFRMMFTMLRLIHFDLFNEGFSRPKKSAAFRRQCSATQWLVIEALVRKMKMCSPIPSSESLEEPEHPAPPPAQEASGSSTDPLAAHQRSEIVLVESVEEVESSSDSDSEVEMVAHHPSMRDLANLYRGLALDEADLRAVAWLDAPIHHGHLGPIHEEAGIDDGEADTDILSDVLSDAPLHSEDNMMALTTFDESDADLDADLDAPLDPSSKRRIC